MKLFINLLVLTATASSATLTRLAKPGYTPHAAHRLPNLNPLNIFNNIINPRSSASVAAPNPVLQLLYIAPTSNTCAGAANPNECATSNPTTVSALVAGFVKYNISTPPEQAALLSWMAYESADFKYNRNHFPAPGKPGQGTRCMMSPVFVKEYASSIPEIQGKVAALTDPDAILALVQPDEYSFAAASWFYHAHCTDAQKTQVQAGGQTNWATAFITGCVHTAMDDSRIAYWKRANEALAVADKP